MARYLYDVNRTTRFFDVHKQFQGGLKTVDTDDALGAVFLREAQNVSLSEFGFIEKRYGTYFSEKYHLPSTPDGADNVLQGYWEFKNYKIHAHNNKFYVNGTPVSTITKEKPTKFRYPDNIDSLYPFVKVGNDYRDMNAVNIKDVLYIFTGYYPVYAKVVNVAPEGETEDLQLKFYWFSVDIPTYDEIVVVGHNLLEDDYETLYSEKDLEFTGGSSYNPGLSVPLIRESNYLPKFPFVINEDGRGKLDFEFKTEFPTRTAFSAWNNTNSLPYVRLELTDASYRSTGAGSSSLDFIPLDLDEVSFEVADNYSGSQETLNLFSEPLLDQTPFVSGETKTVGYPAEFGSDQVQRNLKSYSIEKNVFIPREVMNESESFSFTLLKVEGNEIINFNLAQYQMSQELQDLYSSNYIEPILSLEIQAVDLEGNEKPNEIYKPPLNNSGHLYQFDKPAVTNLNVSGFNIKFRHRVIEAFDSGDSATGPIDISSNVDDYRLSFSAVSLLKTASKKFAGSILPGLSATVNSLISGRYDFGFTFALNYYDYNTSTDQIKFVSSEEFSTIVDNITVVEEELEDYPGAENVPVKLKPVWTCNKVIEHFGKLMIWGSKEMPTAVFYSFPDRPTFFPSKFYLDFQNDEGSALQNITPYMNILVAQTEDRTWGVRGNSGLIDAPSPYVSFTINPTVGTIAYKSVRPVRNHLFFLSKQGIVALKSLYAADEQYNIDFVDRNIRNIVPQDKNAVGIQYDNQYWLNFPNFGITLRWYIDKKAWVKDVFAWENFKGVFKWQNVDGKLEFITYPNALQDDVNSYVYKIGIDESLPADMGDNVLTKFETSFLNQNYPFHQKNYKEFKYDFTMQNEYNFSRDPIYDKTFDLTDEVTVLNLQEADLKEPLLRNHTYMLSFSDVVEVDTVTISKTNEQTGIIENTLIESLVKYDGSYYLDGNTDYFFTLPNSLNGKFDINIQLTEPLQGINERVSLRDTTYDETMVFLSKVITEERNVINQQLPIGYTEQQESIEINLADFQDFTLGTTFFGDRITFIKTIKLSGKGYNTKAYFEDVSKAKWTIESMGITYKMKRARGD